MALPISKEIRKQVHYSFTVALKSISSQNICLQNISLKQSDWILDPNAAIQLHHTATVREILQDVSNGYSSSFYPYFRFKVSPLNENFLLLLHAYIIENVWTERSTLEERGLVVVIDCVKSGLLQINYFKFIIRVITLPTSYSLKQSKYL